MQTHRIVLAATLLVAGGLVSLGITSGREADAQPVPQCSDGEDNDGDTFVDYPADPDCLAPDGNSESGPPDLSTPLPDSSGPADLSTGFTNPDGGTVRSTGPDPAVGGGHQPPREEGCSSLAGRSPPPRLPIFVGTLIVGLMLMRVLRRRT